MKMAAADFKSGNIIITEDTKDTWLVGFSGNESCLVLDFATLSI